MARNYLTNENNNRSNNNSSSDSCFPRFSSEAVVDIHFGQYDSLYAFQAEVDTAMPFMGGHTYIDKALRAAQKEFKTNANPRLPKVGRQFVINCVWTNIKTFYALFLAGNCCVLY